MRTHNPQKCPIKLREPASHFLFHLQHIPTFMFLHQLQILFRTALHLSPHCELLPYTHSLLLAGVWKIPLDSFSLGCVNSTWANHTCRKWDRRSLPSGRRIAPMEHTYVNCFNSFFFCENDTYKNKPNLFQKGEGSFFLFFACWCRLFHLFFVSEINNMLMKSVSNFQLIIFSHLYY